MRWRKAEREFVSRSRVARLATADAKGVPSNVPVCPLFEGGKIYVGTAANARKARNIFSNPNVSLAFGDYSEDWAKLRGVSIQGQAVLIRGRNRSRRAFLKLRQKLYAKYSQYESVAPLNEPDAAIIEVNPHYKMSWGI
jgi:nitroimidazol reductase NimA-like FMN-containing flavoprotein (pyridoxamine 5'-phosphate oxidase superfamily)